LDPISTASAGLIRAAKLYDQANQAVARAAAPGSQASLPSAVVSSIGAKTQFEASARALKAEDEMFQSTLDILV
jgi:hypothetical protein